MLFCGQAYSLMRAVQASLDRLRRIHRYTIEVLAIGRRGARRYGETFPFGTLVVNLAGCFVIGFLFYLLYERALAGPTSRTTVFIGLLGGFTTFSSYGLQTFTLSRDGELLLALINVAVSNIVGLALVWLGYSLAKVIA